MKGFFSRLLPLMLPFAASAAMDQVTPEGTFWEWFQNNESTLFDFEKDQEHTTTVQNDLRVN